MTTRQINLSSNDHYNDKKNQNIDQLRLHTLTSLYKNASFINQASLNITDYSSVIPIFKNHRQKSYAIFVLVLAPQTTINITTHNNIHIIFKNLRFTSELQRHNNSLYCIINSEELSKTLDDQVKFYLKGPNQSPVNINNLRQDSSTKLTDFLKVNFVNMNQNVENFQIITQIKTY